MSPVQSVNDVPGPYRQLRCTPRGPLVHRHAQTPIFEGGASGQTRSRAGGAP
jgi:hypothetical protein